MVMDRLSGRLKYLPKGNLEINTTIDDAPSPEIRGMRTNHLFQRASTSAYHMTELFIRYNDLTPEQKTQVWGTFQRSRVLELGRGRSPLRAQVIFIDAMLDDIGSNLQAAQTISEKRTLSTMMLQLRRTRKTLAHEAVERITTAATRRGLAKLNDDQLAEAYDTLLTANTLLHIEEEEKTLTFLALLDSKIGLSENTAAMYRSSDQEAYAGQDRFAHRWGQKDCTAVVIGHPQVDYETMLGLKLFGPRGFGKTDITPLEYAIKGHVNPGLFILLEAAAVDTTESLREAAIVAWDKKQRDESALKSALGTDERPVQTLTYYMESGNVTVPFLAMVHDSRGNLYVVTDAQGQMIPFAQWAKENKGKHSERTDEKVQEILEHNAQMLSRAKTGDFSASLADIEELEIQCVDYRVPGKPLELRKSSDNKRSFALVKTFGGTLGADTADLIYALAAMPRLAYLKVGGHGHCGYRTGASIETEKIVESYGPHIAKAIQPAQTQLETAEHFHVMAAESNVDLHQQTLIGAHRVRDQLLADIVALAQYDPVVGKLLERIESGQLLIDVVHRDVENGTQYSYEFKGETGYRSVAQLHHSVQELEVSTLIGRIKAIDAERGGGNGGRGFNKR